MCKATVALATVPYNPEFTAERSNHGYRRLVGAIDLIDAIPEVKKFTPLGPVLRALNAPGGELETIGCGIGAYPHPKDPGLIVAGAFIHVIFREAEKNFEASNHEALANHWADQWAPIPGTRIDFIVDPLQDFFGHENAWSLKVEGVGVDRQSEDLAWARARAAAGQLIGIIGGASSFDPKLLAR